MLKKRLRRILVTVAGFTVLAIGIAMLVLPGPAFVVIPLGLAILASEFPWAKRLRDKTLSWLRRRAKGRFSDIRRMKR
jgi:uncharacterized protein (TIGR02611 family)